jgi:hypothetical protein
VQGRRTPVQTDVVSTFGTAPRAGQCARRRLRPSAQLAGVVGAFGRRKKNRYGEDDLPFRAVWSAGAGMVVYEMSPAVATVINEARGK